VKFVKNEQGKIIVADLVSGGSEFGENGGKGDTLYLCSAIYKGNFVPGKYHSKRKSCHFVWEGFEHSALSNFQILQKDCSKNVTLAYKENKSIPDNVVEGGKTSKGEILYPISCEFKTRGRQDSVFVPGSYQHLVGPYMGYGRQQIRCEKWWFLACVT